MTEEIELAAKSTGAVVGAVVGVVLEAGGVTKPTQEVTGLARELDTPAARRLGSEADGGGGG